MRFGRRGLRSLAAVLSGVALLIPPLLFVCGCSEEENPAGFDGGPRGPVMSPPETLLITIPEADAEIRPSRTTGASRSILVGADEEAEARGLVRFDAIPDTAGMRRAFVKFHLKKGRGEPISLAIREVVDGKASWDPTTVLWSSMPRVSDAALATTPPIETGAIADTARDSTLFELPPDLVRRWYASPDSNGGLAISAGTEGGIARIVSHNDLIFGKTNPIPTPSLRLLYASGDSATGIASADAYVIRDKRLAPTRPDTSASIHVTAGTPARMLVRFGLGDLPSGVSVVRATLRLPVRSLDVIDAAPIRLAAYEVTQDWTEADAPDSITVASTVLDQSDTLATPVRMEVGDLAQRWVDGTPNRGVSIRVDGVDEISTLQGVELYSREAPEPAQKPSLFLIFVRPLDPRWKPDR